MIFSSYPVSGKTRHDTHTAQTLHCPGHTKITGCHISWPSIHRARRRKPPKPLCNNSVKKLLHDKASLPRGGIVFCRSSDRPAFRLHLILEFNHSYIIQDSCQTPFVQRGVILLSTPEKPPIRLFLVVNHVSTGSLSHFMIGNILEYIFTDPLLSCISLDINARFIPVWV